MKTRILLLLFGLASLFAQAQQTKTQTETQIDTLIPTNSNKQVTALKLRTALKAVVNYAQPSNIATGAISLDKISTSGASLNQVLKFNGTSTYWGNDVVGGGGGGGATWGTIPGTLADQTDLMLKFAAKSDTGHTHSNYLTSAALLPYLTKDSAALSYQPIGSYLTSISSGQVTTALGFTPYNASNPSGYITASAITGKLNIADTTGLLQKVTAAALYQPKGSYLTGISSGQVTTALGFTPYNASNPSGYITSSALAPYLTTSLASSTYQPIGSYLTTSTAAATYQPIGSYLTASSITGKLNIADTTGLLQKVTAAATYQLKGSYLTTSTAAATYQPIGSYLTGISSGQVTTALGFTPYNATNPSGYITSSALAPYLTTSSASSTYQPLLVSGINLKTINGASLLGSSNITMGDAYLGNTQTWTGIQSFSPTTALSSGSANLENFSPTVNQSGTAGYVAKRISVYEQATGSGSKLLLDLGTNSAANGSGTHTSKFSVTNNGNLTVNASSSTLADFQAAGVSRFSISNIGVIKGQGNGSIILGYNGVSSNFYDADTHYFRNGSPTDVGRIYPSGNWFFGSSPSDVASAQVIIGSTTKGFLLPRQTTTQINAIASPATGLLVYDTDVLALKHYTGSAWQAFQPFVQYKDEGSNLGSAGSITSINFTGSGTTASYSGANLTVDTKDYESLVIPVSDETTPLTTGVKWTFPMPFGMTVTEVKLFLTTPQSTGSIFTATIKEGGTTILSTALTVDNTENSSLTAVTLPVISDTSLANDAKISIEVTQVGDGTAKGMKVTINGYRQ